MYREMKEEFTSQKNIFIVKKKHKKKKNRDSEGKETFAFLFY